MAPALVRCALRASLSFKRAPTLGIACTVRYSSNGAAFASYLITPRQLSEALAQQKTSNASSKIIPLCAAWFLPNDELKRTGRKVFEERRIPSARFFDIDEIKDPESPYPHMLPTSEGFAEAMSSLGLKKDDCLVVYDSYEQGIFSAPRAGFTLKVFGHPRVHVLNNFKVWVDEGYLTETGKEGYGAWEKSTYSVPKVDPDRVAYFRDVRAIAQNFTKPDSKEEVQIIDARSPGRFNGTAPEPRPGLSSGHIPGSYNVPLPEILDPKTKTFLPRDELREIFENKGLDPKKPIISSCGTGVMAAALDIALGDAGFGTKNNKKVYDGSWT